MGKMGISWKMVKMGKMGRSPKYPKNGQNAKNGEIGDFAHIPPKMGILRLRLANTPHRLDMIIFLEITPGESFYTLLLRVSIFDYL